MAEGRKPLVRGIPLVTQLTDTLRAAIRSGEYGPGDLLPSETALMKDYGVSRNVVRPVFATLRAEGLITVINGRGSFVREAPDAVPVPRTGADPWAELTRRAEPHNHRGYADRAQASALKVPVNDLLFIQDGDAERADGRKVSTRRIIPCLPLEGIKPAPDPFAPFEEIRAVLAEHYGTLSQQETVSGLIPDADEGMALGIQPGFPVFEVLRLTVTRAGRPLIALIERTALEGTAYTYRLPAARTNPR